MKLTKIRILNYKSIMDVIIDVEKQNNSYTTILVGKNEVGKSNLLEAISFLAEPDEEYNYETLKNAQNDNSEDVSFYYTYSFESNDEWQNAIKEKAYISEDLLSAMVIGGVEKNIYLKKGLRKFQSKNNVIYTLSSTEILNKFYFKALNNPDFMYEIISEKELSKSEHNNSYQKLDSEELNKILAYILEETVEKNKPNVTKWMYSKEYLITKPISLQEFKENSNICLPLKNIFKLANIKTKEEIVEAIDSLNISPKNINKLERVLENTTTEYISTVWPECNIKFKYKIQNDLALSVYVFDKADEVNSFYMSDRSDGFKQFISLILSISAENNTDTLKNNLILIDEPETHMHPSGIKYMKEELVRIGQNNYVFLSTHSEFMIDSETKKRHYIVTKHNNNTQAVNWNENSDIPDDEVLRQAFGLNLLCEFINKFKENGDCVGNETFLDKALMTLYPDFFVTSDKARCIIDSNTNSEKSEDNTSNSQTSPLGEFKISVSNKFREILSNTKNCLSLNKTV